MDPWTWRSSRGCGDEMTSAWLGETLLGLLTAGLTADEAAQRLLDDGADVEMVSKLGEFLRALDEDPSARDRARLLVERTRVLAERGTAGEERSDQLRAAATRMRSEAADEPDLPNGVLRHELSTPIAVASMALEMLATRHEPASVEQLVEIALRNVRLASRLLTTWGKAERLTQGLAELSWTQVDLGGLVRDCVADLDVLHTAQHQFNVSVEHAVVLPADPDALRQIVFNLLTNAAKYSPKGSPIDVAVTASDEHAEVAVRDRGPGISPEDTERIFRAGERVNVTPPGMGPGLVHRRPARPCARRWTACRGSGSRLPVRPPAATEQRRVAAQSGAPRGRGRRPGGQQPWARCRREHPRCRARSARRGRSAT